MNTNVYERIEEAMDANGTVFKPEEAVKGEKYFCVFCGVGVYKNTSVLGKPYFATLPGCAHTAPECEMVSMQTVSSKRRYQTEKTNPRTFLEAILREPVHAERPVTPSPTPLQELKGIVPQKLRPFRSLGELHETGTCYQWPGTRMGDGYLSDCCVCVEPLISNVIDDPLWGGKRIIIAGVDDIKGDDFSEFCHFVAEGKPRIAFAVFTRYGGGDFRRKYLVLECGSDDVLESIMHAMYDRTLDDKGRTMYTARCRKVLVAGDWRRGHCYECPHPCSREARKDCRGVLVAPYISNKQIYGIPYERRGDDCLNTEGQSAANHCLDAMDFAEL